MLDILFFSNVLLVVLSVVFLFKKILNRFIKSNKGYKNICLVCCVLFSLFWSIYRGSTSIDIDTNISAVKQMISQGGGTSVVIYHGKEITIDELLAVQEKRRDHMIVYTLAGLLVYGACWAIHLNILKENRNRKHESRWNLDQY